MDAPPRRPLFVDRESDLRDLDARWGTQPQLYLLWGRRRVGKSALVRRFAEGRDALIFQAFTGTATEQLRLLTRRILAWRHDPVLAAAPLANWEQAFAYLEMLLEQASASGEQVLLVLDEFQYLASADATVISRTQEFYDRARERNLPLFLILTGSQVSFFEDRILIGPLFGRRTGGGQLTPLDYRDAGRFFSRWDPADRLRAWALVGGMPYYLEQLDPDRSLAWNIRERILGRAQVLYNEAELLLREELSDTGTYFTILAAIAAGSTRVSEIATAAGRPVTTITPLLDRLARLHLVEREVPVTDDRARSRRGVWRLVDQYLASWFRYVRPFQLELEDGRADLVYAEHVAPTLDEHVSRPPFERACRSWVRARLGRDPRLPAGGAVGAWWGQIPAPLEGPRRTRAGEAEVVVVERGRAILVGEAKWSDRPVGPRALDQLRATIPGLPGAEERSTRLALFSRSGFTDALRRTADRESILLVSLKDMYDED